MSETTRIDAAASDRLVDEAYLASVAEAVGAAAMADLVASMLKDCRAAAERLEKASLSGGEGALAREAHRLGGLLAQFGCPAAGQAFKAASHATPEKVGAEVAAALVFLGPTIKRLSALYPRKS